MVLPHLMGVELTLPPHRMSLVCVLLMPLPARVTRLDRALLALPIALQMMGIAWLLLGRRIAC